MKQVTDLTHVRSVVCCSALELSEVLKELSGMGYKIPDIPRAVEEIDRLLWAAVVLEKNKETKVLSYFCEEYNRRSPYGEIIASRFLKMCERKREKEAQKMARTDYERDDER